MLQERGQSNICFLSGLLICGECGYSMSAKSQNKNTKLGTRKYVYICCNTKKNRGYNVCPSHLHLIHDIEEATIQHLINHIKKNKIYNKIGQVKENIQIDTSLINQKNLLEAQINKSNNEISNLLKMVAEGNSVANNYVQKSIEDIDTKIQEYKLELDKIEAEIYNAYSQYDNLQEIKEYLKNPEQIINCDFDTKKAICKAMIKNIILKDDDLKINYLY